ncbi:MAG: IgGFc-binding protein, partial [Myxococcota bacterium]|nr:IgGFc-binding protein [Myxococcota bacterium]
MVRVNGLVLGCLVVAMWLQSCSKDEIGASSCPPGAFRCTEDGAQTCDFNGAGWIETPCAQGDICVPGECDDPETCPDECQPKVCEPGASVCGADHLYVYQCDDTGTELCYSHSCSDPPLDGVCFNGECVSVCDEGQKSYLGCEYFAVDLDNADVFCGYDELGNIVYCDAADSQYAVVLSNPNVTESAYVMIAKGALDAPPPSAACSQPDLPENYVDAAVIPPKGIKIFELPSRNINGTIIDKLAYRIVSNIPVTAYQFNPLENVDVFSNDASVLLPTTTASQDFLVMTREQTFDELKGFLTVVGIDDEPTLVGVTVTTRTLPGPGIPALQAGEQFTTTLEKYEVLNIETNFIGGDLTGSRVQSDRGVLVFAGSEAANTPNTSRCDLTTNTCEQDSSIACGCTAEDGANCSPHAPCAIPELITCCADHLEQQIFPTSTWGTDYIAIRSYPRGNELDAWRIMAAEDNTQVTFNPAVNEPVTLNRG